MEKLWFELGKQFSKKGHSVCHISRRFAGLPNDDLIDGVRHLRVKGYDTPANGIYLKLLDLRYSLRALKALPPADILITNTFWMPILAGGIQNRIGLIMVDVNRMPKGQMRFYRQAACLRVPSSAVREAIVREAPRLSHQIRTIPNPLPALPSTKVNQDRDPVILYCGRLIPEKGIVLLIQAFTNACERGLTGWSLRLVGPADTAAGGGGQGWLEDLLSIPRAKGLPIEWLGPIYDVQELLSHYQQASIFVYPSLADKGEALPVAPLEAMACGAVPIVSDLACFRDFITPGVNGLVFNHRAAEAPALLAHQILDVSSGSRQREAMSQAALGVRQSHHPAAIANDFLRCFEEMIQPCPSA